MNDISKGIEGIIDLKARARVQEQRITDLEREMLALRMTARVLLQNAEGCAVNHYGEDFQLHGEPGWLKDCRQSIERAEAMVVAKDAPAGMRRVDRRVAELEAALQQIAGFSDMEMRDGDAAREVAERMLLRGPE